MDDLGAKSESDDPIKSEQVEPDQGCPDINSDDLDYEAYVEKILEGVESKDFKLDERLATRAVLGELKNNDDPKEAEFVDFEREIPEFYVKQESCEVKLEVHELIIKPEAEEIEVEPDSFECSTCGKSLQNRDCLEIHELVHKEPPPLGVWKVRRARSKLWKCAECGYKTNHLAYYEEHLLGHEDPPKVLMYRCQFCGYTSRSQHEVLSHTKVIHAKAIHEKVIPDKLIPEKVIPEKVIPEKVIPEKVMHRKVTHAKVKHAKVKHTKVTHAKVTHAKDKSTRDRATRQRNSNKQILQDHSTQKAPTELKAFVCSSCDYQTYIKQKFIKHVIVHKHKKGNIFRCTECYCETKCKESFDKHIRRHKKQALKKQQT